MSTSSTRHGYRLAFATATAAALVSTTLSALPAASAALGAPAGLGSSAGGSSTPTLSWSNVVGASEYDVQADDDPGFGSPDYSMKTANTKHVPNIHLPSGTVYWRVRAAAGKTTSSWAKAQVSVNAIDVPAPTHPANGVTLQQPEQQPLLRWNGSRGAVSYTVQVDGDADFVGAQTYTTKSTSFVVPNALTTGDWFWRVVANKSTKIVSVPSPTMSFVIQSLASPDLDTPANTHEEAIEDVMLDWKPVPGALTYDLQIALDDDFVNFAFTATDLHGTRYSPPTTLNNDEFWWRVRAVDAAGVSTPWTQSKYFFKRQWLDQPTPVHPLGTSGAPGVQGIDSTYFQWTPTQHATHYEVEVASDITFNDATSCTVSASSTLTTAGTTFVPRLLGGRDCLVSPTTDINDKKVRWWRVRAYDLPYNAPVGLPGVWSQPQAFYRNAFITDMTGPAPTPEQMLTGWATGLKVSMTGQGARDGGKGCAGALSVGYPTTTSYVRPATCEGMTATPVLSWQARPHIESYIVWFAQDENFTTTEVQPIATRNTMLALDYREKPNDPIALPESESGRPYYWHVQACTADACSPRPDGLVVGIGGAAAFGKVSPPMTGLRSATGQTDDDIWFSWDDYQTSNAGSVAFQESGQQTARQYTIQVATDPGFANEIDRATVDQATYTAGQELYPQGTIYWRVRALDAQENKLPWTEGPPITKKTPAVPLLAPVNGVRVSGTTPFEWLPQNFASSYQLEVYSNADVAFSPGNRVLSVSTSAMAYAPSTPLPASNAAYVWRVRKTDNSKNPGPWSPPAEFYSAGVAPELLAPSSGAMVGGSRGLLQWSDVPGAASYVVRATNGKETQTKETVATAWAPSKLPDGNWTWTVTARDAAEQALGTSGQRGFTVDGTGPKVVKIKPSKPKPTSTLVIKFNEKIKGATKSTIKLTLKGAKGKKAKVKAKVKVKGAKVKLNPKGKLKRGQTYILKVSPKVTDAVGNPFVAKKIEIRVK